MLNNKFDCIIIGTGLAGVYTALNIDSDLKIALFSKDKLNKCSSTLAQGGIACELSSNKKKLEEHFEDTLKAGCYLNELRPTEILINEGKDNIKNLISLGAKFDKDSDNEFIKTLEGAHSSRRILHAQGDSTGSAIMNSLYQKLEESKNITVYDDTLVYDFIKEDNNVIGIKTINKDNQNKEYLCKKVVIASGGCGAVYSKTTNEGFSVGDGIALAFRNNALVENMCFMQFHPTGLYEENSNGRVFLISEALRGEGAILRNIAKEPFMEKYDIRGSLAPRDVVSRAIYNEMKEHNSDYVYLDITSKSKEFLETRFPSIYNKCLSLGIDISKDYIKVRPVSHFLCGGIYADLKGKTNINNVYAVGECASTRVHGANRLASNSLLECLVFGKRIADDINKSVITIFDFKNTNYTTNEVINNNYDYSNYLTKIRDIMDNYVFIERKMKTLNSSLDELTKLYFEITNNANYTYEYYNVLNAITSALLIVNHSLKRTESIGCHYIINDDIDYTIVDKIITDALKEDIPGLDLTTDLLISNDIKNKASLIAKEDGVLSGIKIFKRVFTLSSNNILIDFNFEDGQKVNKGDVIGIIYGRTKDILKGERVALNLLQRMSGIATVTKEFVDVCVKPCRILDTRKTTPNLRYLEKLAVKDGGGTNHRYSLSDMVMIKDNHIKACNGITNAVNKIKELVSEKIEVEVETLEQFKEALTTPCDRIMLDNMSLELMSECVKLNNGKKELEASGNMTLSRIKEVSKTGVDFISVGALTHSPKSLDISLKF